MGEIRVSNGSMEEPAELIGHGEWWIPGSTASVRGIVRFSEANGIQLSLEGDLRGDAGGRVPVLFGRTVGLGNFTLIELHSSKSHSSRGRDGSKLVHEEWRAVTMLVGAHIDEPDNFKWDSAHFGTTHLGHWAGPAGNEIRVPDDEPRMLTIEVPSSLSATTDSGAFVLAWGESTMSGHETTYVSIQPSINIQFSEPMTQTAMWPAAILPSLFLMNFLTDETNYLKCLRLMGKTDEHEYRCEVYGLSWSDRAAGERNWHNVYPLQLSEIRDEFSELVSRWFSEYDRVPAAFLQHYAHAYSQNSYLEEHFARSIRANESWHRATQDSTMIPTADYENLLEKVRLALDSKEWRLAKMRLKFGNEPTLERRLREMISLADPRIASLIRRYTGGDRAFLQELVKLRNKETHALDSRTTDDDVERMVWGMDTLRYVFLGILTERLQFSNPVNKTNVIERRSKWRSLNSQYNVFLRPRQDVRLEA